MTEKAFQSDTKIFDYIRAIAICSIIFYHFSLELSLYQIRPRVGSWQQNLETVQIFKEQTTLAKVGNWLLLVFSQGWQFVGVFILLSGFGLTFSQLRKPQQTYSILNRLTKLLAYWPLAILVAYIANYIGRVYLQSTLISPMSLELVDYFWLLMFPVVVDTSFSHISAVNPSLWFMVLIFQFYLVYGFLYEALKRFGRRNFLIGCLTITILYRLIVIYFLDGSPTSVLGEGRNAALMNMLPARLFEFGLGMMLAYSWKTINWLKHLNFGTFATAITLFVIGTLATFRPLGWIFSDIILTTALIAIYAYLFKFVTYQPLLKVLSIISAASYFIFLLHNQIITQIITPSMFILTTNGRDYSYAYLTGLVCSALLILALTIIYLLISQFSFKKSGDA